MSCLFCKIVQNEIPSSKLYESEDLLAFRDIRPQAPQHILVIPKKHIPTLNQASAEDTLLLGQLVQAAKNIAETLGIAEKGYRISMNCNAQAGQEVYHLHLHLLGGRRLSKLG